MFLPMTASITVANMLAGRLTVRLGLKPPILLGQTVLTIGLFGLLFVDQSTPPAALLALLVPVGIGSGVAVPAMTAALLESVNSASAGLASGILNAARQVGGALGGAYSARSSLMPLSSHPARTVNGARSNRRRGHSHWLRHAPAATPVGNIAGKDT
ncbi:hypothetical protein GCM10027569_92040 [Flindersiella endophytica]